MIAKIDLDIFLITLQLTTLRYRGKPKTFLKLVSNVVRLNCKLFIEKRTTESCFVIVMYIVYCNYCTLLKVF
jgi:hypothetical protein